jgi:hypothetical protein
MTEQHTPPHMEWSVKPPAAKTKKRPRNDKANQQQDAAAHDDAAATAGTGGHDDVGYSESAGDEGIYKHRVYNNSVFFCAGPKLI